MVTGSQIARALLCEKKLSPLPVVDRCRQELEVPRHVQAAEILTAERMNMVDVIPFRTQVEQELHAF